MRRAAAPEWPARGGCESACVWQCEHAHAVRVCCMWWGMCGGGVGHVDGPWGGWLTPHTPTMGISSMHGWGWGVAAVVSAVGACGHVWVVQR